MSFAVLKTFNSPGFLYYHLKCGHCGTECGVLPEEIVRREYKFQTTNDNVQGLATKGDNVERLATRGDNVQGLATKGDNVERLATRGDTVVEFIWNCAKCNNENADLEKNLPSPILLKMNVAGQS